VAQRVDELIVGSIQDPLAEIRNEVVLANFRADLARNNGPALGYFLRFILVEHLLHFQDRTVKFRGLQRRNQMVDYDRQSAPLGLQALSDAIHGIKVYGGNRADHDIGKIKLGKRHLFAREPFVTGMPADMDNHIRLENIANVFVKRQVLMTRGHYVRTVHTVGVRLPSALRLWTYKNIAQQQTWNNEIAAIRHHRVSWRLAPAG